MDLKQKKVYIHTIGCQMNVYDAEQMERGLSPIGYVRTPEIGDADLILLNTCAIRAKAEQKVFSFLGRLVKLKNERPELIIAVGGCVAQQEGKRILSRAPYVDAVFGTHAIGRLPGIIEKIRTGQGPVVDVALSAGEAAFNPFPMSDTGHHPPEKSISSFVTIMQGCDNFCTYCVVPYVRGREASRHPDRIAEEIRTLVAGGVREVTLLGQNVNSYGKKEGLPTFTQLLERMSEIEELSRIRFTTSHPKDLSDELIGAFGRIEKLCRHIHLPVQSGSDIILSRMNRKYTRKEYLAKIDRLRAVCPDIAISSDFIVGFPGETGADFQKTLELIQQVQYDSLFAFKYSDRPQAPAARFSEKIDEAVKAERLAELLDLQQRVTLERHRSLVGQDVQVLVDGYARKNEGRESGRGIQWTGRTDTNKIVNFYGGQDPENTVKGDPGAFGEEIFSGRMISVRIKDAFPHSLIGVPLHPAAIGPGTKGEKHHAA